MQKITLIATTTFGLEAVVKREVQALGFDEITVSPGKVVFPAELADIPRLNLWLRSAERLLLRVGEYSALTFEELFDQTAALPWEDWIPQDGKFTVRGKSVKSQLSSVPACQSIVKKAIVERLKQAYRVDWFEESGAEYTAQVALLENTATLTLDTSGDGLTKRGYRVKAGAASIKETLAAGLVQLSFWQTDRLLVDPMCGSGTILIEAALIGRNMAPGLYREFASEQWGVIPAHCWGDARREAEAAVLRDLPLEIYGYDIDPQMIEAAKANAGTARVANAIHFEQKDIHDLWIDQQYGIVISNPPYGMKLGEFQEMNQIYITLHKMFKKKLGWSVYIITADKKFPDYFKRAQPNRRRKLYNGGIEVQYYQYYGERPPREESAAEGDGDGE